MCLHNAMKAQSGPWKRTLPLPPIRACLSPTFLTLRKKETFECQCGESNPGGGAFFTDWSLTDHSVGGTTW